MINTRTKPTLRSQCKLLSEPKKTQMCSDAFREELNIEINLQGWKIFIGNGFEECFFVDARIFSQTHLSNGDYWDH